MCLGRWLSRHLATLSLLLVTTAPLAAPAETPARSAETGLLSNTRQLTFEGRRAGEGYFSRDGKLMVFQSEREPDNPFYQIYLLDLETGDTTRVSPGYGKTSCAWIHPDQTHALFASTHEDPAARDKQREELEKRAAGKGSRYSWSFDEHYDIYQTDLAGHDAVNLTHTPGYDAEGSWSPDGKLIAFASNRAAYAGTLSEADQKRLAQDASYYMDIYIMDADGGNVHRLTNAPGYDGGPFFSPDGRRIVWRRFSEDGATAEVWTMNIDGSDARQITHLGFMSWAPYYHPSGDYIIFATNKHGFANFELYLVDSAGRREPVRVTESDGFDGLPVFSPDGKRLAWASGRSADHSAQIFLADWDDAEARRRLGLDAAAVPAPAEPAPPIADTRAAIDPADLEARVRYLASAAMDGRLTGSPGEQAATAYVAEVFAALGLQPAGDDGDWFQPFTFTAGASLGTENHLRLQASGAARAFAIDQDWRPLDFSRSGAVEAAPVVFAGYGIVAPASEAFPAYDSYQDLDVRDKWVLVFRYLPESVAPAQRQHLARYSTLRYKAMLARDHGARGLLIASGPNAAVKEQLVKLTFDAAVAATSIAALSVTDATAEALLQPSGKGLKALQDALDGGEAVAGFEVAGQRLSARVDLRQEQRQGRNVLARLPAGEQPTDSIVVIGAHVDHLGHGIGTNSLARSDEAGQIHFGADDNASGVAGLLEMAQDLVDQQQQGRLRLKRDILFAAWSGEELGLIGSGEFVRAFAERHGKPERLSPAIAAYLNMDMIGRLDKSLYLQGVGSSSVWKTEIERRNAPLGLPIVTQADSYLPTDTTSFYLQGVPILGAFTGSHAEYHTPRDTPEKLNYEGAARITRFVELLARALASADAAPDYVAMEKPAGGVSRRDLRAYLGTIPEYGGEVVGVKLSGVAKAGPAEKAGLEGGDVIVGLGGTRVENIYDYTYALNALKPGAPVEVVVERDGQRVTLTVTPEARE